MSELSEVSLKINEIKRCSRFISDILTSHRGGLDPNRLPIPLLLKMKEIREGYDREIDELVAREQKLLNTEIGEDASSWLKNHGFVFDREVTEYTGNHVVWYRSDYIIGRICFRRNEWVIRYGDVIGRFKDIVGHDYVNGEVSGIHPAAVVAVILNLYKDGLKEMESRIQEALDKINIFDTKYTVERVHNE